MCRAIEQLIVRRIIGDLMAKYPNDAITIDSEHGYYPDAKSFKASELDAAVNEAFAYDECHIFVGGSHEEGYGPWVYLIFGNGNCGFDVISDYLSSLDPIMEPIFDWIRDIDEGKIQLIVNEGEL